MLDLAVRVDFDHVKSGVGLLFTRQAVALRDLVIALLFHRADGFAGRAEAVPRPRFDLDENRFVAVLDDDIRFPKGRAVIGFEQLTALLFQVLQGELFPLPA